MIIGNRTSKNFDLQNDEQLREFEKTKSEIEREFKWVGTYSSKNSVSTLYTKESGSSIVRAVIIEKFGDNVATISIEEIPKINNLIEEIEKTTRELNELERKGAQLIEKLGKIFPFKIFFTKRKIKVILKPLTQQIVSTETIEANYVFFNATERQVELSHDDKKIILSPLEFLLTLTLYDELYDIVVKELVSYKNKLQNLKKEIEALFTTQRWSGLQ